MMSVILPNIDAANPWLVLLFSYALLLNVAFMQAIQRGCIFTPYLFPSLCWPYKEYHLLVRESCKLCQAA